MVIPQNPFVINGYQHPKFFCDRKIEAAHLQKYIAKGDNVVLVATRRMGKSELIRHCFNSREFKSRYATFFIDIYATKSLGDLVFLLCKSVFNHLKQAGQKTVESFIDTVKSLHSGISFNKSGAPTLNFGIADISKPEETMNELFDYLEGYHKPCVVAISELQQAAKYPERNVKKVLQSYIRQDSHTRFIFAGSPQLLTMPLFNSATQPFFADMPVIQLYAIEKEHYVEFAQRHFAESGKEIETNAVEKVYDMFGGATWYIQQVLNVLYTATPEGENCTLVSVPYAVNHIVEANRYVYAENMFRLPDKQGKLLIAIARDHSVAAPTSSDFVKRHNLVSASSVQAALTGLLEKDFIMRGDEGYSVYDKFFERWINDSY